MDIYTIVEFGDNDKWFVMACDTIKGNKYSYLIKVNEKEDDFIDEYQVVKSYFDASDEYMDVVSGDELKEALKILAPEAKELIDNPEKLKKILNNN